MDMLNYREFSAKFPLCNNGISSEEAWSRLLKDWRDDGKLVEKKHWRWGPPADSGVRMTRRYDVLRVVKLIVLEHQAERTRPRIEYLCQTYTEELTAILTPAVSADPALEQATSTPE